MARVDSDDVRVIIDTTLTDATVDVFIDTANLFIENAGLADAGVDEDTLTEIEKYLSAHFLSVKDPRVKSEKIDIISQTYTGQFGFGLKQTQYGQTAILLDFSGTLGRIAEDGGKKTITFGMIGYHDD